MGRLSWWTYPEDSGVYICAMYKIGEQVRIAKVWVCGSNTNDRTTVMACIYECTRTLVEDMKGFNLA